MRKALALAVILLLVTGCARLPIPEVTETTIDVVSEAGAINRPIVSSGDDWHGEALERRILDWNPGRDQYGNSTGLSSDRWKVQEVEIQCELKTEPDTLYFPPRADTEYTVDGIPNRVVWYPAWTAPIEGISGLPYSPFPETGYPFDACEDKTIDSMPRQEATMCAAARADWIEVEIHIPREGEFTYDGGTPTSQNTKRLRVGRPRTIEVVWTDGTDTEVFEFDVLVEWFWIDAQWDITVGAAGCSN